MRNHHRYYWCLKVSWSSFVPKTQTSLQFAWGMSGSIHLVFQSLFLRPFWRRTVVQLFLHMQWYAWEKPWIRLATEDVWWCSSPVPQTSVKMKLLCSQVVKDLLGDGIDVRCFQLSGSITCVCWFMKSFMDWAFCSYTSSLQPVSFLSPILFTLISLPSLLFSPSMVKCQS